MTNISQSFTYKMAAKINRHRYGTIITSLSLYVLFTGKKLLQAYQLGNMGNAVSSPCGSGCSRVVKRFLLHFESKYRFWL